MKNWKHWAFVAIIAIVGIIMGFLACNNDNGTTTHTHEWEWKVTTSATYTTEGVETETCVTCGQTNGTRSIARIPFTSVADLGTWLTSQPANTADTAFTIALNVTDISSIRTTLNNNANKYVYLDLSSSSITTIPDKLFYGEASPFGCATLTGIIIPDSVTSIGNYAFYRCSSLASITIGNGVTSIEDRAFDMCDSFESITIPAKVTSIKQGAFFNDVLIKVTFLGIITADNLGSIMPGANIFQPAFDGDLDTKYLEGGIGTYTATKDSYGYPSIWTKQ